MVKHVERMIWARRASLDDRGASAADYGLLIAGVVALAIALVFLLGGQI